MAVHRTAIPFSFPGSDLSPGFPGDETDERGSLGRRVPKRHVVAFSCRALCRRPALASRTAQAKPTASNRLSAAFRRKITRRECASRGETAMLWRFWHGRTAGTRQKQAEWRRLRRWSQRGVKSHPRNHVVQPKKILHRKSPIPERFRGFFVPRFWGANKKIFFFARRT